MKRVVLVFDCGATNVRAIAVDQKGDIVHREARPNAPVHQRPDRDWLIWDIEAVWKKLIDCAKKTIAAVGKENVAAIALTSFSDDGAPVDREGKLLYPVISWQCPRTGQIADHVDAYIPFDELFRITGEQVMRQHTLFRLIWLRQNAPQALERAHKYLMVPGILNHRLTGQMTNDPTTADSMMLLDIKKRAYSALLMGKLGLSESFFGPLVEPGTVIGTLTLKAARLLDLAGDIPVVAAGHDTQFAVAGSGAAPGEAVLSSGTWEILFARSNSPDTSNRAREAGLKNECDAVRGLFDVGFQWIGSGALEWAADTFYPIRSKKEARYNLMIDEARRVLPGSGGLTVHPSLLPGSGIARRHRTSGTILGLTLTSSRGQIYRAFLEGLSFQLREAIDLLGEIRGAKLSRLTVVGGGSRNGVWNQIRADVTNLPIRLTRQVENTVVGAAIFAFIGAGLYRDYGQAVRNIDFFREEIHPSPGREVYDELYDRFREIGPALKGFYSK